MSGDSPGPGHRGGQGGTRDDRDLWLRAFELAADTDIASTPVDAEEMAEDKRAFLERLGVSSEAGAAPVESRRRPLSRGFGDLRTVMAGTPLLVLLLLVVLSIVFPSSVVLGIVLFGAAPAVLTLKWGAEAYYGGHELTREGELLGERAHEFRLLRRRLDALTGAVDRAVAESTDPDLTDARVDLRDGIVTVSGSMRSMTDRLRLGSRGARRFATLWRSEPIEACDRVAGELRHLEPDGVAADLRVLLDRLTGLLPKVSAAALPAGITAGGAAEVANEIDEVRRLVARSRESIVGECRRLSWSFDWLHNGAARRVVKVRLPGAVTATSLVGVAGQVGLVRMNLSTSDPVARTRRRVRYLASVDVPSNRTVAGIRRATADAVRGDVLVGAEAAS